MIKKIRNQKSEVRSHKSQVIRRCMVFPLKTYDLQLITYKLLIVCSFTFLLFAFAFTCFAEEITIIYTGQTHAVLYPCNCPIEPDGGLSRRAALIKELRKNNPLTLLLDSGNFFAGGLKDEHTQNTEMDMQRTIYNLKAMEIMKYDAAAIGGDEFNFGIDFLKENITKTNLKFLSCNISDANSDLKSKGVLPFITKEIAGVKIGIIALTALSARQKAPTFNFIEPKEALKTAMGEIKNTNPDIIILLSNLSEAENSNLVKEISGIDILIADYKTKQDSASSDKIGSTLVFNTFWQGRKVGVLFLTLTNNKITNYKVDMPRLSDKISSDPEIQTILPRCFEDTNCKADGIVGVCRNPGSKDAGCEFPKSTNKVKLTIIQPKACIACFVDRTVDYLKARIPGIVVSYLDYPDRKTNKLVKDLDIHGLPAYLLGKEIEKDKGFVNLKQDVERRGDFYIVKPHVSGVAYFLKRDKIKGSLDLFISLYGKETISLLEAIKEFNPQVHFLAVEQESGKFDAFKGEEEIEEYLRCVCIKKYYPKHFWDYMFCRVKDISSSWWDSCLSDADYYKIKACATSEEGKMLLRENIRLNKELRVLFGPAYLLDNNEIFSTQGIASKEDFEKIFKIFKIR